MSSGKQESDQGCLMRFLCPRITKGFLLRVAVVAACAFVLCRYVCIPMRISGSSMEPTYRDGGFNFCWRAAYMFGEVERHDVVVVRLAGPRVMFLKRVVAFEGETVAFSDGQLIVNDRALDEPYLRLPCDWDKGPVTVDAGNVFVVGDNRSVPIDVHRFGQTQKDRIMGVPLW